MKIDKTKQYYRIDNNLKIIELKIQELPSTETRLCNWFFIEGKGSNEKIYLQEDIDYENGLIYIDLADGYYIIYTKEQLLRLYKSIKDEINIKQ